MKFARKTMALVLALVMCLTLTVCPVFAEEETSTQKVVAITAEHFPDAQFRNYIGMLDDDNDGWLSEEEIFYTNGVELNTAKDFTGIEYLTNLDSLIINGSQATELDISKNKNLTELYCNNTKLETLDVSKNTSLVILNAENTELETLNIGDLPQLENLQISGNVGLRSLTLGTLSQLKTLNVANDACLKELDLRGATVLDTLQASGCDLESVTLASENALQTANLSNNSRLVAVDFSGAADLNRLEITNCALTQLDLSQNLQLSTLKCDYNNLRSLTVAKNKALEELTCTNNELACLNLGYAPAKITASSNVYPIELNAHNTFDLSTIPGYDVAQLDKSGVSKGAVDGSILTLSEKDAAVGTTIVCPYQCAATQSSATSFVRFQLKVVGKKTEPEPPTPPVDPDNPPEPAKPDPETPKTPAAPKTVRAALYGHDDIKASWSRASSATGYKVYLKKYGASVWTYKGRTTGTSFKMANLTDGARYYVKVVSYNAAGTGGSKIATSVYTLKRVAQPTVKKYSRTKVRISWKNIYGESGYQISKSRKKTGTYIVSTYKTTSGKTKLLSATRNRTYYYKVRAFKVVDGKRIYAPWSSVRAYRLK